MTLPPHPDPLLRRHVEGLLRDCIRDFRVTIVNGPRQAGKTTLPRQMHAQVGGMFVTFDDDAERVAARNDPQGYLASMRRPLFVDEVQRAGDPFILAVKAAVDREQRPGGFILSGSSRFLTIPTLSESLAGRAALIELWPFSVAERTGTAPTFVDRLFDEPESFLVEQPHPVTRHEYMGYPVGPRSRP